MKKSVTIITVIAALFVSLSIGAVVATAPDGSLNMKKVGKYKVAELSLPAHKHGKGKNRVQGVILHHTATLYLNQALGVLCYNDRSTSTHVLIDRDGTRYVLAPPEQITYHAGYSILKGRSNCNSFTIGIEFQGNTVVSPLTDDQINSAIDYLIPIIKKYKIPLSSIVTHEQVRTNWKKAHPGRDDVPTKVDITPTEYERFMKELKKRYKK